MRRSLQLLGRTLLILLTLSIAFLCYWEFVLRRPVAKEDRWGLWIAALKGFEGTVTYVGDKDGYSFFRVGSDHTPRYKRRIEDVRLPRHFDFGKEDGYRVDFSMVPQ
jgi:hypothetical protein